MTRPICLVLLIAALNATALFAQSPTVQANYRFGTSGGFDVSTRGPTEIGSLTTIVAGPVEPGSPVYFIINLPEPTPIPLPGFGPNSNLYVQIPQPLPPPIVAAGAFAALPVFIPNDPAIVGASAVIQAGALPLGSGQFNVSNGYSITLTDGKPSSPGSNFPGLAGLDFACNDNQFPGAVPQPLQEFVAFHTRLPVADRALDPRPAFATATRTISGDLADLVVNLPNRGRLEFGRGTSFLPVWVPLNAGGSAFPELVSRSDGDGDATRPDRINRYSYARVVSESANEIVVHWRYIPNFRKPTRDGVVHEIFTIRDNGTVTRRVHRGAATAEVAASLTNNLQQELSLSAIGLSAAAAVQITRPIPAGFAGQTPVVANPLLAQLSLSLDEGINGVGGRQTIEAVSGLQASVEGRSASWHPGVSGTALAFDGYTSAVAFPASQSPPVAGSFSLSCWVSLAAYPFGTVQLAGRASPHGHHSLVDEQFTFTEVKLLDNLQLGQNTALPVSVGGVGYMLAIDSFGRVSLCANLNGEWTILRTDFANRIPLHTWTQITAVYDQASGEMLIYQNGTEVADRVATGSVVTDPGLDFVVGLNREPVLMTGAIGMHAEAFSKSIFGFEGLIDEVRLYTSALTIADAATATAAANTNASVLPERRLPTVSGTTFGTERLTLAYHPLWDGLFNDSGYDDVVVTFDQLPDNKIVFWKGMVYGPAWLSPHSTTGVDIWSHDQSLESANDDQGLGEHMQDKEVRHSHVRVVEQTDARIVVQWRYAVVAASGRLAAVANELSWADEYYTIYPDGSCVRWVQDWLCNVPNQGPMAWQGSYFLAPPGSRPSEMVEANVATVVDASGQVGDLSMVNVTPQSQLLADPMLVTTNTLSAQKLYRGIRTGVNVNYAPELLTAAPIGDPNAAGAASEVYSPYQSFNHYPVCQVPDDGRLALFSDRISHSEGWMEIEAPDLMFYGFTQNAVDALPMVRFWNDPAAVSAPSTTFEGYNPQQHAYVFDGLVTSLTFSLSAQVNTPIQSHCVVVRNWDGLEAPSVTVNGAVVSARTGIHYNEGERTLVVWIPVQSSNLNNISVAIS